MKDYHFMNGYPINMNRDCLRVDAASGNEYVLPASTSSSSLQQGHPWPPYTNPGLGNRQNQPVVLHHGNSAAPAASTQHTENYLLLTGQVGVNSAVRQPGNKVNQPSRYVWGGTSQSMQQSAIDQPSVHHPRLTYNSPNWHFGMSHPNEAVSQTVRHPVIHQPGRQSGTHQPVRQPEIHQSSRQSGTHQPARQPEIHQPGRQSGTHQPVRQPGNKVNQPSRYVWGGTSQSMQQSAIDQPSVHHPRLTYNSPNWHFGMSHPIEAVSQTVRHPVIHQPGRQSGTHQPVRQPEIHQSGRQSGTHQPARQPEIHQPAMQSETHQPVRHPEIHQPARQSGMLQPIRQPEIHQPARQSRTQPVRLLGAAHNLAHSTNSPDTGALLTAPHSAFQENPVAQPEVATQHKNKLVVDLLISHGKTLAVNRQPLPFVQSEARTVPVDDVSLRQQLLQSSGENIAASDTVQLNTASAAISKSSNQVTVEADKATHWFLTPGQAAARAAAKGTETGVTSIGMSHNGSQEGHSVTAKDFCVGVENKTIKYDMDGSHEDSDDDVFQGVGLSHTCGAKSTATDKDNGVFSCTSRSNLQPAMQPAMQPGSQEAVMQHLDSLLKNASSAYSDILLKNTSSAYSGIELQSVLMLKSSQSSKLDLSSCLAAETAQQAAIGPSLMTSSALLQQSVAASAVDTNTSVADSDDDDCIILDFSDDENYCSSQDIVIVKQSTFPQNFLDADCVTFVKTLSDQDHNVQNTVSESGEGCVSQEEVVAQASGLSVQGSDDIKLNVVDIVSLAGQASPSLTSKAKSMSQLSMEGFYRCGGFNGRCSFNTLLPTQLELHLKEVHPAGDIYTCVHCGSQECGLGNFLCHLEQHLSFQSLSLYCSIMTCDFSSSSPDEVINHMGTYHPSITTSHICWRCNTKFFNLSDFSNHIKQNLLVVVRCPHCSAKGIDRKAILTHIATSHPDHGRMVSIQKILLCQERKLNCWDSTKNAGFEDMPILERADSITFASQQLEQSVIETEPKPTKTCGEQSDTGIVTNCLDEVSSNTSLLQHIGMIDLTEQEVKMEQGTLHVVRNESMTEENIMHCPSTESTTEENLMHCRSTTSNSSSSGTSRSTLVQEEITLSSNQLNYLPSFNHGQDEKEDSSTWISHTYLQNHDEELEVCLDVIESPDVMCSFCRYGSKTVEDHLRHILAFHQEHFRGFACQNCDFVSVDPEKRQGHSCRCLRSQSEMDDTGSSAELTGSSSSARTRIFDHKKRRKGEVSVPCMSLEEPSSQKKPRMGESFPMNMTLRNLPGRKKSSTVDHVTLTLRKASVSTPGKSNLRKQLRADKVSLARKNKLSVTGKASWKKQSMTRNISCSRRQLVKAVDQKTKKTFKCKLCGKVMVQRSSVRTHLYRCHPDTMACPVCQEQRINDVFFFRHFLEKHPDQLSCFQQVKVSNYISVGYWPVSSFKQKKTKELKINAVSDFTQGAHCGGRTADGSSLSPKEVYSAASAVGSKTEKATRHYRRPRVHCKLCDFSSVSEQRMRQHIYGHHKEMTKCPRCWVHTTSNRDLYRHLRQEHIECADSLYRQACSQNWIKVSDTKTTQIKRRFKYALLYCKLCKQTGHSRARMTRHIFEAHKAVTQCSICGVQETGDRKLYNHFFDCHFEEKKTLFAHHRSSNWFTTQGTSDSQHESSQSKSHCEALSSGTIKQAKRTSPPSQSCQTSQKRSLSMMKSGAHKRKILTQGGSVPLAIKKTTQFNIVVHCKLCSFKGGSPSTLYRHLYLNHTEVQCRACSTQVKSAQDLRFHLNKRHPETASVLYAKSQPAKFMRVQKVLQNLSEFTRSGERKWLRCPYCKGEKQTQTRIENEIRFHIHYKPFCCPYCSLISTSEVSIRGHIIKLHPGKTVAVKYKQIIKKEERHKALLEKAISLAIVENREPRKSKKKKKKNNSSQLETTHSSREVRPSSVAGCYSDSSKKGIKLKVLLSQLPSTNPSDLHSQAENSPDHRICAADSTDSKDLNTGNPVV